MSRKPNSKYQIWETLYDKIKLCAKLCRSKWGNLVLSTEMIMQICHHKEFQS